jgi:hypothetical protein
LTGRVTCGVLGNQAGKLNFGLAPRTFETRISDAAFTGDRIAAEIEFQLPRPFAAPADVPAHLFVILC